MATTGATMFGTRALQGLFGAVLAPAALSPLAVMFTDARERARAFGIYGAISGGGGAVGLILGGFLTEYLDWRWTFFVNIPFALVAAAGTWLVIREPEGGRNRSPLDTPGVLLSALGLVSLVYGFTRAESDGWSDAVTIGLFIASAVLLLAFVVTESRVKPPLLPLRVITERNRGGVYLSLGLAIIAMFGMFPFCTERPTGWAHNSPARARRMCSPCWKTTASNPVLTVRPSSWATVPFTRSHASTPRRCAA